MVTAGILDDFATIFEGNRFGIRRLEQAEQPVWPQVILFCRIDHHGVVVGGAAKAISSVAVRCIDVAAGIDDKGGSAAVIFKRQQIVVLVISESVGSNDAVGDEEIMTGGRFRNRDAG